ncbi:MAG: tRNA uracil 4-sulfurtransferase ThiI [Anaerolineae bacterium]
MLRYLVHYGELGLKGRNRPHFERALAENMRRALAPLGTFAVRIFPGYMLVESEDAVNTERVERRLAQVFGIAYFAPIEVVPQEMDAITGTALRLAREVVMPSTTFKVETRRADKRFPVQSPEVNRRVGAEIVDAIGAPVDLTAPEATVYIQIYPDGVYVFNRRIEGPGGLPVGVSGKVMVLLSGGIDSPVAAHLMLKRGCEVEFVHVHLLRGRQAVRENKVVELARRVVGPHRLSTTVHMLPAHPFQVAVLEQVSDVELVVFRRFMLRAAERLAQERGALALVTGDNLGQVASQTLKNLYVTGHAVEMPVLRPLVAFDKQEIVSLAEEIGTYKLSIQPYKDVCSIRARHPATGARIKDVWAFEARMDLEATLAKTLAQREGVEIRW